MHAAIKELNLINYCGRRFEAVDRRMGRLIILSNERLEGRTLNKEGMLKQYAMN